MRDCRFERNSTVSDLHERTRQEVTHLMSQVFAFKTQQRTNKSYRFRPREIVRAHRVAHPDANKHIVPPTQDQELAARNGVRVFSSLSRECW
jgi:hypothetical protein